MPQSNSYHDINGNPIGGDNSTPIFMAPGAAQGLSTPGNTDLTKLPIINNPDGSWSTVNSTSFQDEKPGSPTFGKEVLVRGILNNQRVDPKDPGVMDAIKQQYYKTGQHLGVFNDGDSADVYAQRLHSDWEAGKIPGVAMPQSVQGYHDATGKPIHIDPSSGGLLQPPPGYAPDPSNSQLPGSSTEQIDPNTIAPFLGRFAANSLPMAGSFLPVPGGTALGRVAATGLQYASPGTFGEPPDSVGEFAKRLGVDYLTNVGIPKVIGAIPGAAKAVARSLPAVKEGTSNLLTKNILSQYSARPESAIVEDMASQFNKGVPGRNPNLPNIPPAPSGGAPLENNPVGQMLQRVKSDMSLPPDVARTQEISKIADTTFSDLRHVQNAKLVADPDSIAELGYKKLLGNQGPIDARGILKELGGDKAEVWQEGLGQNLPAFKEAMGEIAKQQEIGPAGRLLNYAGHHLIWTGLATGGVGLVSHPVGAAAAGAVITNSVFGKLMNSEYAPVVVAALKATPGSPQAGVINQFMQAALKSVGAAAATAAYGK